MLKHSPTAEISLRALSHNYRALSKAGGVPLLPVVKADAYGHGALAASRLLLSLGAPQLAVAGAKEALALSPLFKRRSFCNEHFTYPSILILGPVEKDALPALFSLHAVFSVHSERYARELSSLVEKHRGRLLPEDFCLPVAVKAETGMHRLGLESIPAALSLFRQGTLYPHTLYTHFAEGGRMCGRTLAQARAFGVWQDAFLSAGFHPFTHASASAALCRFGAFGADAVRVGLALYGVSPSACDIPLSPVMRFYATVLSVKRVRRGEGVGYGSFRAEKDTRIAVLGCGYADGIPPTASGARLFLKGFPSRVMGEVCMDRTLVDIGSAPIREGDTVCLFGDGDNPTARIAEAFGVSPYLLLSLRSSRTERVFVSY